MARLLSLPDDLILAILSYLPNTTLLALTTVSKTLHRCSISTLYRYVYLWESHERHPGNYTQPNVPDWRNWSKYQHLGPPPSSATRIFDSSLFLDTITSSEQLRSYVVGASITCRDDQEETAFEIVQLLQSSLSYLHLKCPLDIFHKRKECLSTATCLEIEISERRDIETEFGDLRNSVYKTDIISYFDLPDITRLDLSGIRNYTIFTEDIPENSHVSNITFLRLSNTVPADKGLAKLLSWPKALKSLHYELGLSEIAHNFFAIHPENGTGLSASEFGVALRSQEDSLENLFIYGDTIGDCTGFEPEETIDLHLFTSLKNVGLPLSFLFITQSEAEYRGITVSPTAILDILPPGLEKLQIEIPDEYHWSSYFSRDLVIDDIELSPGELSAFICEIVTKKATRFPRLQSIVFWQRGAYPGPCVLEDEGSGGCAEVIEVCREGGVYFGWNVGIESPVFGE